MKKSAKIVIIATVIALIALMYFLKNGFGVSETTETAETKSAATSPAEKAEVSEPTAQETTEAAAAEIEAEEKKAPEFQAVKTPVMKEEEAPKKEEAPARLAMTQEVFDMEKWLEPGLPLLVDFGSKSCGPCQKMKPDLTKFYEAMEGRMTVVYLDVWEDAERTGGLPANVVPTQYLFNPDGTPYIPSEEFASKYADRYYFLHYSLRGSEEVVLTAHQGLLFYEDLLNIAGDMGVEL